jgi:nitrogen fixation protein FixH
MTQQDMDREDSKRIGRIVLFGFLGLFIVCGSVDAFFIVKAVDSHRGVVTENAYEKGLAFNETLKKAAQESQVSPVERLSYEGGKLNVHLKKVEDLSLVVAHLKHPVQDGKDMRLDLTQVNGQTYASKALLPKGNWHMILEMKWNNETQTTYHHNEEFSLR